jgi:hypothetical protein
MGARGGSGIGSLRGERANPIDWRGRMRMATSAAAAGVGEEADTIGVFFRHRTIKRRCPTRKKLQTSYYHRECLYNYYYNIVRAIAMIIKREGVNDSDNDAREGLTATTITARVRGRSR